jgi:hypothetical protein
MLMHIHMSYDIHQQVLLILHNYQNVQLAANVEQLQRFHIMHRHNKSMM